MKDVCENCFINFTNITEFIKKHFLIKNKLKFLIRDFFCNKEGIKTLN